MKFGGVEELPEFEQRLAKCIGGIRTSHAGLDYEHDEVRALAQIIATEPQASDADLLRSFQQLECEAGAVLEMRWPEVEEMARLLLKHGALTGKQLRWLDY